MIRDEVLDKYREMFTGLTHEFPSVVINNWLNTEHIDGIQYYYINTTVSRKKGLTDFENYEGVIKTQFNGGMLTDANDAILSWINKVKNMDFNELLKNIK